ncbi:MAG TPA: DUF4912 domain-containing protein [Candidatus Eisenbacteria bacterium]|uniref:DUF4912 domain-containing protein n=1 Tax=Eiseniibacteriota bacterium TaxID=2212470 RepID=A0A7V2F340_UNCEI|nr:DUF4912 domain-containing protein [Candidatus Eisenbacteria bacterium]
MTTGDLKKMKKAELIRMAKAMRLDVRSGMLKGELVSLISRNSPNGRKTAQKKAVRKTRSAAKKTRRSAAARSTAGAAGKAKGAKKAAPAAKPARRASKKSAAAAAKGERRGKTGAAGAAARGKGAKAKRTAGKRVPRPAAREKHSDDETIRQKAEAGKYYLGVEEKEMPPVESLAIPAGYNVDRIQALVRDPRWVFTYWEVADSTYRELERKFGGDWPRCRMTLRVYDRSRDSHFDIALAEGARNWYIQVEPEGRYQIALGLVTPDGGFYEIILSNVVETPRVGVSDIIDDRWMIPDELFDLIFSASGGHDLHAASAELRELVEQRLLEQVGSEAVSSFGSGALRQPEKERGFRLWVATELILYGATEPDARLTVQGKEVKLRGDGSFSMRFALPDGKIEMPVTAVSADRIEERTIETSVEKKSKSKEPVKR